MNVLYREKEEEKSARLVCLWTRHEARDTRHMFHPFLRFVKNVFRALIVLSKLIQGYERALA
jgi:hypothetical protein